MRDGSHLHVLTSFVALTNASAVLLAIHSIGTPGL